MQPALRTRIHLPRWTGWTAAATAAVVALGVLTLIWWVVAGRFTTVPAVVGLDRPNAERLLARSDLVAVTSQQHDNTAAVGAVTNTMPAADSRVQRGTTVQLLVSTGRPTVPVIAPGTSLLEAQQLLRAADLVPNGVNVAVFDAVAAVDTVVTTAPPAGTQLPIGAPVTLIISRGPAPGKINESLSGLLDDDLAGLLPH